MIIYKSSLAILRGDLLYDVSLKSFGRLSSLSLTFDGYRHDVEVLFEEELG